MDESGFRSLSLTPSIVANPELHEQVKDAICALKEFMGGSAQRVSVEWQFFPTSEPPSIFAKLSDDLTMVGRSYELPDFKHSYFRRSQMIKLWDDLLQSRSRIQMAELISQSGPK